MDVDTIPAVALVPIGHHDTFASALAAAQGEMQNPVKSLTAHVTSKRTGGKYEYRYADLAATRDAVIPVLGRHGIALVQDVRSDYTAGTVTVSVVLLWRTERLDFCGVTLGTDLRDPQVFGTTTTYARRYTLGAVAGVAPEFDDDGESVQTGRAGARPNDSDGRASGHDRPGSTHAPAPVPMVALATDAQQRAVFAILGRLEGTPKLDEVAFIAQESGRRITWQMLSAACHDEARGGRQIPASLARQVLDATDRARAATPSEPATAQRTPSGVVLGKKREAIEDMNVSSLEWWEAKIATSLDDPKYGRQNAKDLAAVRAELIHRRDVASSDGETASETAPEIEADVLTAPDIDPEYRSDYDAQGEIPF